MALKIALPVGMMTLLFFFIQFAVAAETIVLSPGSSDEIPSPAGQSIRAEKTGIIQLTDLRQKLRLTGKKIGSTQIKVGSTVYKVWVVRSTTFGTYQKLKQWLINKRGPYIAVENHELQIAGRFLTFEDWDELAQSMDESDHYSIKAKAHPQIQEQIKRRLKTLLESNNLAFSHFSLEPSWSLTLAKTNEEELKSYKRVLSSYGIQTRDSAQAIKSIPLIEVSVVAAEIQRTEMSRLGIQWPASTPFQILPQWNTPQASVLATIHHLEEIGKGRILAKPTLLSQSGEEATFHSGGEFPIKAMNQFQSNVVWKKYGLILKIKPKADHRGKMDLQIDCEFSTLDTREDDSGVPGLIVHRVTSHLNLEKSKTIALSGLIKEEWRQNKTGLPGLLRIPVLSALFSSQSYQNNQSELVFFVTPRVIHE